MGLSQPRVFSASFATGASLSTAVNLAGTYLYVTVEVPNAINTMFGAADTPIYIQASSDGVNFRRYKEILTSTVTTDFSVASSASNCFVDIPYFNLKWIKVEASATVTGAVVPKTFNIICSDSP